MPRVSSKDKYTVQVFELFKNRGLMLNMEQIAGELGLTKKTLYNNFSSKQELIGTVVKYFYQQLGAKIDMTVSSSKNAIDELFSVSTVIADEISKLGTLLLKDISIYQSCPSIFSFTDRMNFYSRLISANLERGIREGIYRSNLSNEYSTLFYTSSIEQFYRWDNEFKYFDRAVEFHKELVKYHLYSLVNINGLAVLQSYL